MPIDRRHAKNRSHVLSLSKDERLAPWPEHAFRSSFDKLRMRGNSKDRRTRQIAEAF
jgi:hypothetical protein